MLIPFYLSNRIQLKKIPETSKIGRIIQYVGESYSIYKKGYFYIFTKTGEEETTIVNFENNKIHCDNDKFYLFIKGITEKYKQIVKGSMTYHIESALFVFIGYDEFDNKVIQYQQYQEDYENDGFVFNGPFEDLEKISFVCRTEQSITGEWQQIDVQP